MSFRVVVISSSAKLDLKLGYLVIRNTETKKISISEIAVLIIESTATSITTALMAELIKTKLKLFYAMKKETQYQKLYYFIQAMITA